MIEEIEKCVIANLENSSLASDPARKTACAITAIGYLLLAVFLFIKEEMRNRNE